MTQTKNIIFDLGGVLLNINYKETLQAFKDLGYSDFDNMYSQYSADALFEDLEKGKISNEDFYTKMLMGRERHITKDQVQHAWNKMLLTFRLESLEFLKTLARKYDLFLLSNTNSIHLAAFETLFTKETGEASLNAFFKKAYYSHLINLRKPNNDIFEFVAKDAGIHPAETLFVDDSYNNIEAAAALGFKTHLLLPEERIQDLDYEK